MSKPKKKISIFYSWQSDLPKNSTRNAIRLALRVAVKQLKNEDREIVLDEATRDEPGSPDIPNTILEKITVADIFIADITTINKLSDAPRKTANPNVQIELGYAIAELGWKRIIMFFNQEYGDMPGDVAFDIDRKRITGFRLTEDLENKQVNELEKLTEKAISLILAKDPLKPYQKKGIDPVLRKRQHDINGLTFLLSNLHGATLDSFLEQAPSYINGRIFHFYEYFIGIVGSSSFFLYDKVAAKFVKKMYRSWIDSLARDDHYKMTSSHELHKFVALDGIAMTTKDRDDYNRLADAVKSLRKNYRKLLDHIRKNYIEIDLIELSNHAYKKYQEEIAD